MNDDSKKLFETLEPPPRGLAGLRGRIARDARRRVRVRRAQALAAATAVVAIVSWATVGPRSRPAPLPAEFDLVLMHLGLLTSPSEALTIPADQRGATAVRRVPLPTDQVVFYMVGSIQD